MQSTIRPQTLLATILIVAFASSCRKTDDGAGGSCEISRSDLTGIQYISADGDVSTTGYSNGLLKYQETLGPDTVLDVFSGSKRSYHIFSKGDYIKEIDFEASGSNTGDTTITYYVYDSEHRLVRSWSSSVYWSGGSLTRVRNSDTVGYVWEDGNLTQQVNLSDNSRVFARFNYVPNSPGRNFGNEPAASSRWLFRKGSVVQVSRNFVLKYGAYEPEFDNRGRLVTERQPWPWGGFVSTQYQYSCE